MKNHKNPRYWKWGVWRELNSLRSKNKARLSYCQASGRDGRIIHQRKREYPLTSASIILVADALLAGIWGMNFVNIAELHQPYGYYAALFLMLVISALLLFVFKRLRWF